MCTTSVGWYAHPTDVVHILAEGFGAFFDEPGYEFLDLGGVIFFK